MHTYYILINILINVHQKKEPAWFEAGDLSHW